MIVSINELISMLQLSLTNLSQRNEFLEKYKKFVFIDVDDIKEEFSEKETIWEILVNLAYDLEFYEKNKKMRTEDPSYYGDDRLEQEIQTVLKKLKELGVKIE